MIGGPGLCRFQFDQYEQVPRNIEQRVDRHPAGVRRQRTPSILNGQLRLLSDALNLRNVLFRCRSIRCESITLADLAM